MIIVLIFILIIFIIYLINIRNIFKQSLVGLWMAPPDFCKNAELESFILYFNKHLNTCWIYMQNKDNILINDIFDCSISNVYSNVFSCNTGTKKFYINIKSLECDFFNKDQKIIFDPISNELILKDDDYITGVFYKDGYQTKVSLLEEVDI